MKLDSSGDNRYPFSQVRLPVDPKREGRGGRINGIAVEAAVSAILFLCPPQQRHARARARWANWTLMEGEGGRGRRGPRRHLGLVPNII